MPDFGSWGSRWWIPVLFVVIAGHLTNVCVTLFLHRAQTHRGVRLHYLAALPMRIWLWMSTAIVTKEWVACHRKHHAFADREGDPHSPIIEGVINGIGHAVGYRNYSVKDESRNISPIAIWLGGEELHNNHHADPKSARFAAKWFEFDIGWAYIRMLQFVRLAKVDYARGH